MRNIKLTQINNWRENKQLYKKNYTHIDKYTHNPSKSEKSTINLSARILLSNAK